MDKVTKQKVYSLFSSLPLKDKLIVYTKLIHRTDFKIYDKDLKFLDKSYVSSTLRKFIDEVRKQLGVVKRKRHAKTKIAESSNAENNDILAATSIEPITDANCTKGTIDTGEDQ